MQPQEYKDNELLKIKAAKGDSNDLQRIKGLFFACISRWYWFLISVLICVGIAWLHVRRTPPTYVRSTDIQIKSEGQGKSMPGGIQSFNDLGIFRSSTNVHNELRTFRSPDNMFEIVRRLNLDLNYSVDGRFHKHTLYGRQLPVNVTIGGIKNDQTANFDINLKGGGVTLSNFVFNGEEIKGEVKGKLNDSIKTPIGNIYVAPTEIYSGREDYPVIHLSRNTVYNSAMHYLAEVTVGVEDKETDVITITCRDVSPERAEDILGLLTVVYNEKWIADKNKITESTSAFIRDRLDKISVDLNNVDEGIADFKSSTLTPDISAAAGMYMGRSVQMGDEIMSLNNNLTMTHYIRDFIAKAPKDALIPSTAAIGNSSLESQIASYNSQMIERNNLVAASSEHNSSVQEKDAMLATLRGSLLASIDNQERALKTQIGSLQKSERQTTGKLAANPEQEKDLLSVTRQQKVKEALYLFLLQKLEENELSQAFTAYNTRVIKEPSGSMAPASPDMNKFLMIALIIGLIIPFAVIYLKEQLNTTVRGRQDLNVLTIPFLGEIPQAYLEKKRMPWQKKSSEAKSTHIVVEQGKRDVINEAFRVVRTNLEFMTKEHQSNVIIFTSYNVNSGKTFTAMNMAITIALKGKNVLVIDGDMRKASLSAYVESPEYGISNYLSGKFDNVNDVIVQHPEYKTLSILPVGTIPPNPTELISEDRFGEAISKLRNQYDYILIDCPPVEILADTQIIEKLSDRTIFVVRAGLMERGLLSELEAMYQEHKFKNLSVILNGTNKENSGYGRYGYTYGYAKPSKKRKK